MSSTRSSKLVAASGLGEARFEPLHPDLGRRLFLLGQAQPLAELEARLASE